MLSATEPARKTKTPFGLGRRIRWPASGGREGADCRAGEAASPGGAGGGGAMLWLLSKNTQ